jgi:Fe-Mn family superoxide dismutase
MAFEVPQLSYAFDALEPFIDKETMQLHHDKHHQAYVDKLNDALKDHPDLASMPILDLLQNPDKIPEDIRTKVRNNGGGHANHTMFWKIMAPKGGGVPTGTLLEAINSAFSSFEKFQEEFSNQALNHFGSGWAWLTLENNKLHVCTTPNQDTPIMKGNKAILGLDVWEHAYYLKYQNRRAEYIKAWWSVVNWPHVQKHFDAASH